MRNTPVAGLLAVEKEMRIGEVERGQRTCSQILAIEKGDGCRIEVASVQHSCSWIDSGGMERCTFERGGEHATHL